METYGTPQIQALTRASRAFYENPPEGFTEHPLLHRAACCTWPPPNSDLLQQTYDEFRRHSDNVRLIEPQAAAARVPCLRAEQLWAARWRSRTRATSTHGLHQGFLRGMRARGATLRANAELRAASHADGVWTLTLADGATRCARAPSSTRPAPACRSRGRAVRRRAGRPAALPPHRLHLQRSARRDFPPGRRWWRRRKLLLQARRRSAAARRPTRIRSRRTTWRRRNWTWPPASTASRKLPR